MLYLWSTLHQGFITNITNIWAILACDLHWVIDQRANASRELALVELEHSCSMIKSLFFPTLSFYTGRG